MFNVILIRLWKNKLFTTNKQKRLGFNLKETCCPHMAWSSSEQAYSMMCWFKKDKKNILIFCIHASSMTHMHITTNSVFINLNWRLPHFSYTITWYVLGMWDTFCCKCVMFWKCNKQANINKNSSKNWSKASFFLNQGHTTKQKWENENFWTSAEEWWR